jgi:hypothetical protein
MYILGRELQLIPFNTWVRRSALHSCKPKRRQ